jgi:hypothetical protein
MFFGSSFDDEHSFLMLVSEAQKKIPVFFSVACDNGDLCFHLSSDFDHVVCFVFPEILVAVCYVIVMSRDFYLYFRMMLTLMDASRCRTCDRRRSLSHSK